MKKLKIFISLLMFSFLLLPIAVKASDANINITTSSSSFNAGDTITVVVSLKSNTAIGYYEYTLDYDTKKLKLLNGNSYVVNNTNDNSTKKVSKSFKFKVKQKGNSKITVNSYTVTSSKDEKNLSVSVSPLNISNTSGNKVSKDIFLKSLEVENYKLNPNFDKKVTKYTVSIDKDIKKINIKAEPENSDYTVSGDGQYDVSLNSNSFDVTVKDKKGNSKTYTINTTFNKQKPIEITINDVKYTVVTDKSDIEIPSGFEEKTINIDGQEVTAYYNENTNETLVALRDEDGNVKLFLYDEKDGSYNEYEMLTFDKVSFVVMKTDEILNGYHKDKITIEEKEIDCLKLEDDSSYALIYGMNVKNGDKGWYSYDSNSNTLQKYNNEIDNYYKDKDKNTRILIYILAGTTILFGIMVITLAVKLTQRQKRY